MTVPVQQQTEGLISSLPLQYPNNSTTMLPAEQSVASSMPVDSNQDCNKAAATESSATQLPHEVRLVKDPSDPSSLKQVDAAAKSSA